MTDQMDMGASDDVLEQVRRAVEFELGGPAARATVSFVGVEPLDILRIDAPDTLSYYVTLGMSRRPMTSPRQTDLTATGPRAELLLRTRHRADGVRRQLAVLAAVPTVEGVVLRPDSTVDLGEPLLMGSRCTGGLLVQSTVNTVPSPLGPVSILRLLPATPTELAWCRLHGAAALRARWADQRTDLDDLMRRSCAAS